MCSSGVSLNGFGKGCQRLELRISGFNLGADLRGDLGVNRESSMQIMHIAKFP